MPNNDYSITVGSTTWTNDSSATKVKDFTIHYKRNRPTRATVLVFDPSGTVASGLTLGATFYITLKSESYRCFQGVVLGWSLGGGITTIEGADQLRLLESQRINEIFFPNARRSDQIAISSTDKYRTDCQISTDAVGFPLLQVDYISPQATATVSISDINDTLVSVTAHVHAAQQFKAEGDYLEEISVRLGVTGAGNVGRIRIVLDNGSTSNPRPRMDADSTTANFIHAKMQNGSDANETFTIPSPSNPYAHTFSSPVKTIPGALYWMVLERSVTTDVWSIAFSGDTASRTYPYRCLIDDEVTPGANGHKVSDWTVQSDMNLYITGMKVRTAALKKEYADFTVDETNYFIIWGGTNAFVPSTDGKARIVYSYGTEAVAGSGKPVNYVLQRCGISTIDIAAAVNATYGNGTATHDRPIIIRNLTGIEALEDLVVKRYANTAKTKRARFFSSRSDGTDRVYVKLENLTTDASWITIQNGKDGTTNNILLENNLSKSVAFLPNRRLVVGVDGSGLARLGMAQNTTSMSAAGARVQYTSDTNARTAQEATDAAKSLIDTEYSESYKGGIVISGYYPEASGYFSISGNTFNDIITLDDSDAGITSTKFRAEEVEVRGASLTTLLTLTQRTTLTSLSGVVRDVERRATRRESADIEDESIHAFWDTSTPSGTLYGQFEVSGTAVPAWDGNARRLLVTSLGNNIYGVTFDQMHLDFGSGSEPTATRDITAFVIYNDPNAGTAQITHTYTSDDKPRFTIGQRVHFIVDAT